ncbi:MAG: thioesterase [Chloroflexi bacterium]|nr:thioesterase [Chloroflexota bacterium]
MMINLNYVEQLPLFVRQSIPEAYLDAMGHMNVRHYIGLFDDTTWHFFTSFGMNEAYYSETNSGAFALEQHIRYFAEVHVGETVGIRSRILNRTLKRIHFMHFMINETTQKLAATVEVVGSHASLEHRRTSPFPPHLAANIDAILEDNKTLEWDAPVCGVMNA